MVPGTDIKTCDIGAETGGKIADLRFGIHAVHIPFRGGQAVDAGLQAQLFGKGILRSMAGQVDSHDTDPGGRQAVQQTADRRALLAAGETVYGDDDGSGAFGNLLDAGDFMKIGLLNCKITHDIFLLL